MPRWSMTHITVRAAPASQLEPRTLLRAKPSKDGDAELRDYGDASR